MNLCIFRSDELIIPPFLKTFYLKIGFAGSMFGFTLQDHFHLIDQNLVVHADPEKVFKYPFPVLIWPVKPTAIAPEYCRSNPDRKKCR